MTGLTISAIGRWRLVVDLFWNHGERGDEFCVKVEDRREDARFILFPMTGREAMHAFYHPFST